MDTCMCGTHTQNTFHTLQTQHEHIAIRFIHCRHNMSALQTRSADTKSCQEQILANDVTGLLHVPNNRVRRQLTCPARRVGGAAFHHPRWWGRRSKRWRWIWRWRWRRARGAGSPICEGAVLIPALLTPQQIEGDVKSISVGSGVSCAKEQYRVLHCSPESNKIQITFKNLKSKHLRNI